MTLKKTLIALWAIFILVGLSGNRCAFAQPEKADTTELDSTKKVDFIFSLGGGVARFMGDVTDAPNRANVHLLGNRAVFGFHFGAAVSKSFTVSTNMFYGKLSGNENTHGLHRNFESNMVLAGLVAEYNFAGLYKDRLPVLNPFINAGVYYGSYWNISTDLISADGTEYEYWSDGKIRDLAEDAPNSDEANVISRDYEYETKLVKGGLHSFNVSAGFGLDLHISRAVTFRLMSRYFFATNDKVDGHYEADAKGPSDGFFYNSLSLVFNAMAFSPNRKDEKPGYKYLFDVSKLNEIESDDRDGDGVADLYDRCAATPSGIEVDKEGCPLDKDVDGIPDYRDKNTASKKDEIVDQNGASINYELVAKNWTESPSVYGISWDKNYFDNPRFQEDQGYTVNVDVTDKNNRSPKIQKILRIPELRKEVLNDSLIVYRLGVYEKYEDVEDKRQELVDDGIYSAYSVAENVSIQSVEQLAKLPRVEDEVLIRSYGVKESIDLIKSGDIRYSYPQLDYILSRFERYLYDQVQEAALVEDYLQAISAYTWNKIVKRSSDTVYARLEQYPIPGSVKRVEADLGLLESEASAESEPIVQEFEEQETVETEGVAAETVEIEQEKAIAEPVIEAAEVEETEQVLVNEPVAIVQTVEEVREETEKPKSSVKDENQKQQTANVVPEVLSGDELEQAIDHIRSTSKLNKQPRINYAPVKPQYKAADVNNDQLISALEIQMVLEDILKGDSEFTSERFNEMNEYFTDFTQNVEPIDFGGTKVAFVNGVLTILKTEGGEYEESSRRLLARKYREADFNKDGELTPEEVQKMIDLFMKGGSPYSQEKVHELIDLFFD